MVDNLESLLGPDTCRLCLKSGRSPTPVSNENLEGSLMAIKIDILTSVKVSPSDKVCPMCRINVKNFYDFRIMCVQSDARIKGFALKAGNSSNQDDLSVIKSDQVVRSYKRVRRTTGEVDKQIIDSARTASDVPGNIDLFKSTADLFKSKVQSGNSRGLFKLKTKNPVLRPDEVFKVSKRPLITPQNPSSSTEAPESTLKTYKSTKTSQKDPLNVDEPVTPNEDLLLSSVDPLMETDSEDPVPAPRADPLSRATGSNPPPLVPISTSADVRSRTSIDPLSSARDPLSSARDPLSSARDPLSSARDPLSSAGDPLSSARDPLSSARDPLSSSSDPLSSASDPLSNATDPLSPDEEPNNITVEPLSPARKDDEEQNERECRPGEVIVKIENTLDNESMSDTQSVHNDNLESDDESETEERAINPSSKPLILPEIKKEKPDYESDEETEVVIAPVETKLRQEIMEEMVLKPEEVIIPELKREPEDPLFMETEFDDEDEDEEDISEEVPSFSGDSASRVKEEPKRQRSDTESLEVLVDPLMLMDEDPDAHSENKLSRLSPVLGNGRNSMSNGKLPLPPLYGARSDKQRGLDFVKKLLKKPGEVQSASTEPVEKPYRCASCDLSFAYYKSYVKHKDRHLGVLSTYPCNLCQAVFATNRELSIHMKKHVEKAFSCDRCYRSFPSKERLQAHYSLHTGDKQYTCDICLKAFAYKSSVVLHMKKMHGEVISGGTFLRCPKCPTEWSTPQELNQHMEMHKGEDTETTSFSCTICSMVFPSKSILNVHARIHLKPKEIDESD